MDKKEELKNCTFVKTVLLFTVIVGHCMNFWNGSWFTANPIIKSAFLKWSSLWLNSFHIYAFTLVSGYIYYYVKFERNGYQSYGKFLYTKFKRLVVPYLFIAVFWVIPFQTYFMKLSIGQIIKQYFLAQSPNQLWFLMMLFIIFGIVGVIAEKIQKHTLLGFIFAIALYALQAAGFIPSYFQISRACSYMIFFFIGFAFRQYNDTFIYNIPAFLWLAVDLIVFVIANYTLINNSLLQIIILFVLHIVGAIGSFAVLQKIAKHINYTQNRIYLKMSSKSMPMYLLHQQLIYIPIAIFNGKIPPILNATINFIFCVSISYAISTVLMNYKITRILIGEK